MSRRMFSSRIINSARFLQMSEGSQLLYFHLGMRADDDGIVEAWPVMKMLGTKPDDFKILVAKEFVVQLNADQVIFIKDWKEHNTIRADRKVNSVYFDLLKDTMPEGQLVLPKPRSDVKDNSGRVEPYLCGPSTDGISKVKISKENTIATGAVAEAFDLSAEIKRLEESERRDLNVIALYLEERQPDIRSKEQLSAAIKRHVRAARELKVFTDDQITGAVPRAKALTPGWTIETLVKVLTK